MIYDGLNGWNGGVLSIQLLIRQRVRETADVTHTLSYLAVYRANFANADTRYQRLPLDALLNQRRDPRLSHCGCQRRVAARGTELDSSRSSSMWIVQVSGDNTRCPGPVAFHGYIRRQQVGGWRTQQTRIRRVVRVSRRFFDDMFSRSITIGELCREIGRWLEQVWNSGGRQSKHVL